ncbi:uncharacterized protein LOC128678832 [Plodia interpunctella]|uniref:uncharacterized protein LOC128678832 n=1 Tax=Plodia interpunctella TaxID=58824 RepID=UPI002367F13F|nr:uncharacterized protein LOC128678832 [Plodia interpunctella]
MLPMKVLVTLVCCVLAARAGTAGSSVAWPGGRASRQLLAFTPPHTKTTAFSTTQYINSVPFSTLSGYHPQLVYQPQLSQFSPFQPAYYPITGGSFYPDGGTFFADGSYLPPGASLFPSGGALIPGGGSYYPPGGILYPTAPAAPITPEQPLSDLPSFPSQPSGDSDTAVVDSAEFPPEKDDSNQNTKPQSPPQSILPGLPPQGSIPPPTEQPQQDNTGVSYPQAPQQPPFPQIPQYPQEPQFPQGSYPQFPQFPSQIFPQPTPSPPTSFPSADNSDKGVDDEDSISVDAA